MKTIIFGAKGQLGCDITAALKDYDVAALDCEEVDITDPKGLGAVFDEYRPGLVINSAAMTDVPGCEENGLKAFSVNALGPKLIAQNCLKYNSVLVHISTDYVFDGKKSGPYFEGDAPGPLSAYGISKLAGEHFIKALMERYFIVRTSGLYGLNKCRGKGGNFIDTMLKLSKERPEIKVVDDEVLTPTFTLDLANQIEEITKTNAYGIIHATNEGSCSWHDFAKEIFEFLEIKIELKRIKQSDFASTVKRPHYSVLENGMLKSLGINIMRDWKVALRDYLTQRKKSNLV